MFKILFMSSLVLLGFSACGDTENSVTTEKIDVNLTTEPPEEDINTTTPPSNSVDEVIVFTPRHKQLTSVAITTKPFTITSVEQGTSERIEVDNGAVIIKNGVNTGTSLNTVQNDDNISISFTPQYADVNSTIKMTYLGSTFTWKVDTQTFKSTKTGQTLSFVDYDDAYYLKGEDISLSRDAVNDVVSDTVTGLMWQDGADISTSSWYDTTEVCASLELGSFNDWRVPNIAELNSIVDFGVNQPSINAIFENTSTLNGYRYWSSSTKNSYRRYVTFDLGLSNATSKPQEYSIRCVRDL